MATRILILGINTFDSGKTNLAIQLCQALRGKDRKVEYFKPVSGHNYWYRYDHTKDCIQKGQLVSYDAVRTRQRIDSRVPIQVANPVHTLWVPSKIERPGRTQFSTLGLAGWDAFFGMQRLTRPDNAELHSTFVVAKQLIEDQSILLTWGETKNLVDGDDYIPVASLERAQEIERELFEDTVNASFAAIKKISDTVVIESFNDSVWPWERLGRVDKVFAVGPGQMFTYSPEKIRKAAFLTHRGDAPIREVTFSRIADLVLPEKRYQLKPEVGLSDSDIEEVFTHDRKK